MDTGSLERWLAATLDGFAGPVTAQAFQTGQSNPTYLLSTGSGAYVLRRKPEGPILKSAHAIDREYRVQAALWPTDVPVAWMLAYCDDAQVIGTEFYVMSHVPGTNHEDPRLPGLTPAARAALMDDMGRVLAAIHDVDLAATGLDDFGPPGNYFDRQISRWSRQYRASETEAIPAMDTLIDWLADHRPPDDGQRTLVHGDFRLDNLLFAPDGTACVAVLDWELATLGHPFADLAGVIMQWQRPVGRTGRGLAGVDRAGLGLPSDIDFIRAYCARRGLPGIPHFGFYLAFCFFRMAAILQGVRKRALEGSNPNPESGLAMGAHVGAFAAQGLEAARTDRPDPIGGPA